MITVDQLPEKAIDAARLAMAIALADDGDGVPECIAAALNAWPGGNTDAVRCGTLILHLPKEPHNDKA